MVDKAKLSGFFKDGAKAVLEPLNKLEDKITEAVKSLADEKELNRPEVKKFLKDAQKWIGSTRGEIERAFSDGVSKTLSILNLPNRDELKKVEKKVNKLVKDVKVLQNTTGTKAKAKKTAKKPTVKKVAVKKAAKKTVKKTKKAAKK